MAFRINEIHAFISEDENGEEGICAFSSNGMMMPMICADKKRLDQCRPLAEDLARHGHKIKLVKFTERVEVEDVHATHGPQASVN